MSYPQYNPYASGDHSSTPGQYGLPNIQTERDPQRTSSHLGPGSSFSSTQSSYRPEQSRAVMDQEMERSVDMQISRAREEVRFQGNPMYQPTDQDTRFTGSQRDDFRSSGTAMVSYPLPSTAASSGYRQSGIESGSSSLDWSSNYKRPTAEDSSRLYSSPVSSNYLSSGQGTFNAPSERQSIPGLGDYDHPVQGKPTASTEPSRPKYTSESGANVLLQFGLEKDDLEHLIGYPEDQITPANLPFILREIRMKKTKGTTPADQPKPHHEPQPTRSASGMSSHSSTASGVAAMHHGDKSSALPQASKVIDYGHTGKYTGGFGLEAGRTSGSGSGGSGSVELKPALDSSRQNQDPLQIKKPLKGVLKNAGSFTNVSSSYISVQSALAPPSNNPPENVQTNLNPTSQTIGSSLPLPKKGKDHRVRKSKASKAATLKEPEANRPPTSPSQIQPISTLYRGVHPQRPGLVVMESKASGSTVAGPTTTQQPQHQATQQMQHQATQMQMQHQPTPPVPQTETMIWPPGYPPPNYVPTSPLIPSFTAASHAMQGPMFIPGNPHPFPPVLPQPNPNQMNFIHLTTPPPAVVAYTRGLPTLAMMHDYAATPPRIFPHTCSLCNKECTDIKDWLSHQNTNLHLESCKLLRKQYSDWDGGIELLPRDAGKDAKNSPSVSAQTYQQHQRTRHGESSLSRSPLSHHGSEGRRDRRRSRSPSPHSSRYNRSRSWSRSWSRSRSQSPQYGTYGYGNYLPESLSPERRFSPRLSPGRRSSSSRSSGRRSPPRRRNERLSPPQRSRETRYSTEKPSTQRRKSSNAERLARKLLDTKAAKSMSKQSDLNAVVKTLSPALMARLGKMKSSAGAKKSTSTVPTSSCALKKRETPSKTLKAKPGLQKNSSSLSTKSGKSSPPTMVKLQGIVGVITHGDLTTAAERFGKTKSVVIFRSKQEAIVCFEKEEDASTMRSINNVDVKGTIISVFGEKGADSEEQKKTQTTKFTSTTRPFLLPILPLMSVTVPKAKVLVSKAKNVSTKQVAKTVKKSKLSAVGAVKKVVRQKTMKLEKAEEMEEWNPVVRTTTEAEHSPDEPSESQIPTSMLEMHQQAAGSPTEGAVEAKLPGGGLETTTMLKGPVTDATAAAASMMSSTVVNLLSFREMEEDHWSEILNNLNLHRVSQNYSGKKWFLIKGLPEYYDGCYTEQDLVELLVAHGWRYSPPNIYVVPHARMAFVMMSNNCNVAKEMEACNMKGIFLKGSQLLFYAVANPFTFHEIGFYKSLMQLMDHPVNVHGTNTVFINNISLSETKDLRQTLRKIGRVRNFLPLLNKVFVEFEDIYEADRIGVWYSLLKQAPSYEIHRKYHPTDSHDIEIPRSPQDVLPDSKDIVDGVTMEIKHGIPYGSLSPFWVTLKKEPFLFATASPWFHVPDYLLVQQHDNITKAIHCGAMNYSTIMLTGLDRHARCSLRQVTRMVRAYFPEKDLPSLLNRVTVLPLQNRAFVFFPDWSSCLHFVHGHVRKTFTFGACTLCVHLVLETMNSESSEEMSYKELMKWSNAGVPDLKDLEDRLLCVQMKAMSINVIRTVMEVVALIATYVNFMPLANKMYIEMADPSGVSQVLKNYKAIVDNYEEGKRKHFWKSVSSVQASKPLRQHKLKGQALGEARQLSEEDVDQVVLISDNEDNIEVYTTAKVSKEAKRVTEEPVYEVIDSDDEQTDNSVRVPTKELVYETIDSTDEEVEEATTTEKSDRSTRGKEDDKMTLNLCELSENPEITYKILDSVEDETADEQEGHRESTPTKDENPLPEESPPTMKSDSVERELREEDATYEIIDSDKDSVVQDDQPSTRGRSRRASKKKRGCRGGVKRKGVETTGKDSVTLKKGDKDASERVSDQEEVTFQSVDSVEDETTDDPPTEQSESARKENISKNNVEPKNEESEVPMYEIVDALEDNQVPEAVSATEVSDEGREEDASPTKQEASAEEKDTPTCGTTVMEVSEKTIVKGDTRSQSDPTVLEKESKQTFQVNDTTSSPVKLDEVNDQKENYPEDTDEKEAVGKRRASSKEKTFATERDVRRTREREERDRSNSRQGAARGRETKENVEDKELVTLDEVGADEDERAPESQESDGEITEEKLKALVTLDEFVEKDENGRDGQSTLETRPLSQEDESVDSLNPETLVTLDEAVCNEEENPDQENAEKTLRSAKRKHAEDIEETMNFVKVDEVGEVEEEIKEELTRTRGRPKKKTRQTPVRRSARGKQVNTEVDREAEKEPAVADVEPPTSLDASSPLDKDPSECQEEIQKAEVEAPGQAHIDAASAGQEPEPERPENQTLEEGEKEECSRADSKVVSKLRREAVGPEAKRSRSQSPCVPADYDLPPFKPNNPLGLEFVVPISGYFCYLCSVFYVNENTAMNLHCSSQRHYNNLQKHYQKS